MKKILGLICLISLIGLIAFLVFPRSKSSPAPLSAPSPLPAPTPKTLKFDASTDLKKELESINPQVLENDFE